jgi:putative heme-binding domain-containing protein
VEKILKDPARAPALRAMALVKLNARQRETLAPLVAKLLFAENERVRLEAIRTLAHSTDAATLSNLKTLAFDAKQPEHLRAEAVLALAKRGETAGLERLLDDPQSAVRLEASRAVRSPLKREQVERPATLDGWRAALGESGDAAAGRRVFFGARANCAACHRVNGRGGEVGPDLSTIARSSSREKLVASILEPSREIGPLYVQHVVQTTDGKTIAGIWVNERPEELVLNTEKSGVIKIPAKRIEAHQISKLSLMPEDLEKTMTVRDFRDLLAFLLSRK